MLDNVVPLLTCKLVGVGLRISDSVFAPLSFLRGVTLHPDRCFQVEGTRGQSFLEHGHQELQLDGPTLLLHGRAPPALSG